MFQDIGPELVVMKSACIGVVGLPCGEVGIVDVVVHDVELHHRRKCLELLCNAEEEVNGRWLEGVLQKVGRLESEAYI